MYRIFAWGTKCPSPPQSWNGSPCVPTLVVFNILWKCKSFSLGTLAWPWHGDCFTNSCKLLNVIFFFSFHFWIKDIFQCMGKLFCVEFQGVPLKFHTKYLPHTLKDMNFVWHQDFKSSQIRARTHFRNDPWCQFLGVWIPADTRCWMSSKLGLTAWVKLILTRAET